MGEKRGLAEQLSAIETEIATLNAELVAFQQKELEVQQEIMTASTDKKREAAEKKLASTHKKIEVLTKKIAEKKRDQMDLQIQQLEAERAIQDLACMGIGLRAGDKKILAGIVASAQSVLSLKETRLLIAKQESEQVEFLRQLVQRYPSGWTMHEDAAKRYLFFRAGRLVIILQDSPEYDYPVNTLIEWLGMAQAQLFFKLDVGAFTKAVKAGTVRDDDGKTVTWEDWTQRRVRSVGTPKVVIKEEGDKGREPVLIVRPDLLSWPIDRLRELSTELTGHEINPLRNAGIQVLGQIRGFSGETLQSIAGIGEKRAAKILDTICTLERPEAEVSSASESE